MAQPIVSSEVTTNEVPSSAAAGPKVSSSSSSGVVLSDDTPSKSEPPHLVHRESVMSESTGSFEPREPHDPSLNHLAKNMFEKTSLYLQGELLLVQEDYKLLENLNKATAAKYSDMRQISANVGKSLHDLNDKYRSLEPLLQQIDQIEDSVNKLEQAAYKLDSYSKRLEAKFKTLEKRQ